jgi:hypothetical protein
MNAERRRSGGGTTARELAGGPAPILVARVEVCVECQRPAPAPGAHHCRQCIAQYVAGLKRRRAAELRQQPLSDLLGLAC